MLQLSPKSQYAVLTQTRAENFTANSCGQIEMWTHFHSHSYMQQLNNHKHTSFITGTLNAVNVNLCEKKKKSNYVAQGESLLLANREDIVGDLTSQTPFMYR